MLSQFCDTTAKNLDVPQVLGADDLGSAWLGPLNSGGVGPGGVLWIGVNTTSAGIRQYMGQCPIEHCQEGKGFQESHEE